MGIGPRTHVLAVVLLGINKRMMALLSPWPWTKTHAPSHAIQADDWYHEFQMRRAGDDVQEDSTRKAFNRSRNWLQEHDYTREYDDKVWFIDETDRQDI